MAIFKGTATKEIVDSKAGLISRLKTQSRHPNTFPRHHPGFFLDTPARGTFMGSRGILHDDQGRIVRLFAEPV